MLSILSGPIIALFVFNVYSTERLSFYKLITSTENYEERLVYLTGYFVSEEPNCLIVSNDKETEIMYREYEMVKFCSGDISKDISAKKFEKLKDKYGSVAGVFSVKNCATNIQLGSKLRYLGCLTKIVTLHGPIYESGPPTPPPPVRSKKPLKGLDVVSHIMIVQSF